MTMRLIWALILTLATSVNSFASLMPSTGTPPGWQRKGQENLFAGAELYRHIDGGAELYIQFGFDRLTVQDYVKDGHEVRVEIYKMNDPPGADAVFAKITKDMKMQSLYGTTCVLDDYQILFRRGAYCVSITTYETGTEPLAAMAALAAKIDESLTDLVS
ncbi:MAG: DUF6599 family protein [Chrysiogenales bacterium]